MMNEEVKNRWVEALRSGEYEQGADYLCSTDNKFCCLGVLVDIQADGDWVLPEGETEWEFKGDRMMIHFSLREKLGITMHEARKLSSKNDEGYSFQEIADIIEYDL